MENRAHTKQNMEREVVIKQDMEDGRLQVLLKEYELTDNRVNGIYNRVIQSLAAVLALLGAASGYLLTQKLQLPIVLYWLIPLFFIIVYVFIIFLVYLNVADAWNARIISERINTILDEKVLLTSDGNGPVTAFFSPRRGSSKPQLLYGILLGGSFCFFLFIAGASFEAIYTASHLLGTLFVLFLSIAIIALIIASLGFLIDLPDFYRRYLEPFRSKTSLQGQKGTPMYGEPIPKDYRISSRGPIKHHIRAALAPIIPRAESVLIKGPFFIYGFATAFLLVGFPRNPLPLLPYDHLQIINFLFRTSNLNWSFSTVPEWAVLALGATYFVVEEVLLQQAKLMWGDLKDVQRDKVVSSYRERFITDRIASDPGVIRSAIRHMIIRWLLALLLGYILGGLALLLVFLIITLHQGIYTLWAKPRSAKHKTVKGAFDQYQLILLFLVSFNFPLRFLAGSVALVGFQWFQAPFVLLFVLFYFSSVGGMAALWAAEAKERKQRFDKGNDAYKNIIDRSQGAYFLKYGGFWQLLGLVTAILIAALLVVLQFLAVSYAETFPMMRDWLSSPVYGALDSINFSWLSGLILGILGLVVTCALITILILSRKIGRLKEQIMLKVKATEQNLCSLLAGASFLAALIWHNIFFLFSFFLLFEVIGLLTFERATYPELSGEVMREQFRRMKQVLYDFLFKPIEY